MYYIAHIATVNYILNILTLTILILRTGSSELILIKN